MVALNGFNKKAVADWTETADTISAEMINAMEKKVRPLRRKFLALKLQMRLAEEEFQEEEKLLAEKQRTQEREMAERLNEEARKEEERKRAAFLAHEEAVRKQAALNNYLRKTVHFDLIPVRLTQMRANDSHGRFDHDYWTMSALHPQKHDMTKWLFSGKEFRLRHGEPYLVILCPSARLGYVKANHQQAKQYYWKAEFQIKLNSGRHWKVIVEFAREENDAPDWNVRFQIKTLIFGDVEIFAYFLGGGLEIVSSSHGTIDRALALLSDDLAANEETVEGILAKFPFATRPPLPGQAVVVAIRHLRIH